MTTQRRSTSGWGRRVSRIGALAALAGASVFLVPYSARSQQAGTGGSLVPNDGDRATGMEPAASFARIPSYFEENRGQFPCPAGLVARGGGASAFVEPEAITLQLLERRDGEVTRGVNVRLAFEGASPTARVEGVGKLPGIVNYFVGNDPAKWRTEIPIYSECAVRGLYPGVDVVVHAGRSGRLEYDLLLEPEADLERVVVRCEGIEGMSLDTQRNVRLETVLGTVHQEIPATWQVLPDGGRRALECRVRPLDSERFGFEVPGRDPSLALVIDPGLLYSTFLGGSFGAAATGVAVDATGVITVAGVTPSPDFPFTPGSFDTTYNGGGDVFISRLDPSQVGVSQLLYATFIGGSDSDIPTTLDLDGSGAATLGGITGSSNFPTTPGAYDTTLFGSPDGFVLRLALTGASLLYSTYLGGSGGDPDSVNGLEVAPSGVITVTGEAWSYNFPATPGAFDTTGSPTDGFVARLDPSQAGAAQLVYSTFVGGLSVEQAQGLAVDSSGIVTICGWTGSSNFPVTSGCFDPTFNGQPDAFVTRLDPSQTGISQLTWSTYLGGPGGSKAFSLVVGSNGLVTVRGVAFTPSFPTTPGAYDTLGGTADIFISQFDPSVSGTAQLVYSTFLGGASNDNGFGSQGPLAFGTDSLVADPTGSVVLTSRTFSPDFPTTVGALDPSFNGDHDVCVARLDPNQIGSAQLQYSTFLGGLSGDFPYALALDGSGSVTVVGSTALGGFPTTAGAFDTTSGGAFITRLDLLPTGVSAYGTSTPGCAGPLAMSVTSIPAVGNAAFAITCGNAPASAIGLLAFSGAALTTPLVFLGAGIWIDLASPAFFTVFVSSNAIGATQFPIPIPNVPGLVGQQAFAQFLWADPCAPGGVSASNALAITVQP